MICLSVTPSAARRVKFKDIVKKLSKIDRLNLMGGAPDDVSEEPVT